MATGPALLNARFEIAGLAEPFHRSRTVWLGGNPDPNRRTKIAALWDTYAFVHSFDGATCIDQAGNYIGPSEESCQRCDFCAPTPEQACDVPPYLVPQWRGNVDSPTVVSREGFNSSADPTIVLETDYFSGCPGLTPAVFSADRNSTFQMLYPLFGLTTPPSERRELASLKVFVVESGAPQTTQYAMQHYVTDPPPSPSPAPSPTPTPKTFYQWSMLEESVWDDNFTSDLRVTRVRILTGTVGTDPTTGRYQLSDSRVVRPSRIIFLKNFEPKNPASPQDIFSHADEKQQRCYADRTIADGGFDLQSCLIDLNNPTRKDYPTTPTLQSLFPEDMNKLTWIAEFYESEGANFDPATSTFDPVPSNAVLAIEFTIERIP